MFSFLNSSVFLTPATPGASSMQGLLRSSAFKSTLSSLIKRTLANFDRASTVQGAAGNRSRVAGLKVEDSTSELWPLADEEGFGIVYININAHNRYNIGGAEPPQGSLWAPRGLKLVLL